ncbi:MAG TPA: hypothetical protein VEU53_07545 [Stellaceae bacterium]|nr:hypothetical protein [Stellaceae bacterium]
MFWHPDLVKLLHLLTRVGAFAAVAGGGVMVVLSPRSPYAALYAVIFLGIALALEWSIDGQSERPR